MPGPGQQVSLPVLARTHWRSLREQNQRLPVSPGLNGGACTELVNNFKCTCPPGTWICPFWSVSLLISIWFAGQAGPGRDAKRKRKATLGRAGRQVEPGRGSFRIPPDGQPLPQLLQSFQFGMCFDQQWPFELSSVSRPRSLRHSAVADIGGASDKSRSSFDLFLAPVEDRLTQYGQSRLSASSTSRELVLVLDGYLNLVPLSLLKPQQRLPVRAVQSDLHLCINTQVDDSTREGGDLPASSWTLLDVLERI